MGLWGKRDSFLFENFLTCGKLSTWILKVSGILALRYLAKFVKKNSKSDKSLWGGTWVDGYTWLVERKLRVIQLENYLHIRCEGHIASCDFLELSHWCVLICVHWNKGLDWNIEYYKQLNMMKKHLCKLRVQASFAFNFLFVPVGCLRMDKRCKCDYK